MEEKKNVLQQAGRKKLSIPFIVALVGSLVLIVTLFLPFASAAGDYREYLEAYPDELYDEELNMNNSDAANLSVVEFIRIYTAPGMSGSAATACLVLLVGFVLFVLLSTLFSVLKKPVPAMIFSVLSCCALLVIKFDLKDRGVVDGSLYEWGIAEVMCYIGAAVVVVGAILLLATGKRQKVETKESISE